MTSGGWDADFENILRGFLPGLDEGTPLDGDASLPGYGLDSIGMVALIGVLQDAYGVSVPPQDMTPAHFRTATHTWSLVTGLRAARPAAS
ncbi:acyl carrier protein [Streptomyces sp. NPDC048441]|uniref:acyl carrier protein n=1 Tax=Streptomyces sp. NPDC048441 TaxID=3365552 RepID=UPI00371D1F35